MTKEQIWDAFKQLAQSQGFYGRLMRDIEQSGEKEEILQHLEDQHFGSTVDLVMYIEC